MAAPCHALDQAMAIQHGMDGASGGDPDIASQAAHQELPDLARTLTPLRLAALRVSGRGTYKARRVDQRDLEVRGFERGQFDFERRANSAVGEWHGSLGDVGRAAPIA